MAVPRETPNEPPARTPRRATTARLILAAILLATALGKLLDLQGFAAIVDTYALLPTPLLLPAATALTLIELGLALWLLSNRHPRLAFHTAIALHFAYAAWATLALARGLSIPNCGCFGVYLPRPLTLTTPLEDLALALIACAGARASPR